MAGLVWWEESVRLFGDVWSSIKMRLADVTRLSLKEAAVYVPHAINQLSFHKGFSSQGVQKDHDSCAWLVR